MQKRFRICLILLLGILFFRGSLFRFFIDYEEVNKYATKEITDNQFRNKLSQISQYDDIEDLMIGALRLTANQLHFRSQALSTDPNELIRSRSSPTHCVGYAAVYAAIVQRLLVRQGWEKQYKIIHVQGNLSLLGIDLHQFSNNPFFRNHDYNIIRETSSGKEWIADPAVYDYLGIKWVKKGSN